MDTILLTGASGFLGSAMLAELSKHHHVVTLGRKCLQAAPNQTHYQGNFSAFEDLRQLDGHAIDAVVHLAAVTGGCLEREAIAVNVEGTRCLMQYLIDRGCRKYVNASSIAVVGIESTSFRPVTLPMSDEHPCLDRDGYGMSKYLMEEVTRYLHLQNPEIDVINLRLAALHADDQPPALVLPCDIHPWAAGSMTLLSCSRAVKAFTLAVESAIKPGVRVLNTVSQKAWVKESTAEVLRRWWGDKVDLSYFDKPGNAQASIFSSEAIERELGFKAF
ncbi:MAG: NAD(P)-dependent oxidoreductase [Phycisphaeraceae bacterium]|nr:NAD(P)-dependent oxidoreductase [Phycisphaeraceae bacterium]